MVTAILIFLNVAVIYITFMIPRVIRRADMTDLQTDYAHRGLYGGEIAENSLPAFAKAVEARYGIELDVQLSRDQIPMVFHDDTLERVCGVPGRLSDYTCRELQSFRLNGGDCTIPTLAEVLELVDGRVPLLVEFKHAPTTLCEVVCPMLDAYDGAFCVESFDPILLKWMREHRPKYPRGQLVRNSLKYHDLHNVFADAGLTLLFSHFLSRPDFVAYDVAMRGNLSLFLCRTLFHVPMFGWTVRDENTYVKLRKKGVSAIFEHFEP